MAQFDVYRNGNLETRQIIPYLVDVQADLLESLSTRIVVPMVRASEAGRTIQKLNLTATVENTEVILSIPELSGVPLQILGERVDNLSRMRADIIAAIDFLLTGS